ncbi:unnamed protein product [Moneuplotes crassus]|uniref:Uncharacterized protein n=1 Tax=Euplotes crassus TaxID=5936 RepID=A0AAD1U561_EUPCR|nr:unnamed protein product [Moneuplotes crassus]
MFLKALKGIGRGKTNKNLIKPFRASFSKPEATQDSVKEKVKNIPNIVEFLNKTRRVAPETPADYTAGDRKKYLIETYGCQMNVADTEVVQAILEKAGYEPIDTSPALDHNEVKARKEAADLIFVNTCSIREKAETKIWNKIKSEYKGLKKRDPDKIIGILGCMAERLKEKLVDNKIVDIVAGPDAYRDIPRLVDLIRGSQDVEDKPKAINVQLSVDETYADIIPVRTEQNGLHAWVSIMRGCNNMCSFCIVPFTRGRERSRPIESIVNEVELLRDQGYKDITLLGQNVNSYHDRMSQDITSSHQNSEGFNELFKTRGGEGARFADLLDKVSAIAPEVRFRFTSPHPKDFPDPVLEIIAERPNLCNQIHLPAQSGNTDMLFRMRRNHTREAYLELVDNIRAKIPNIALSSDFIAGFCDETDEEFADTLSLLEIVKYDLAYLFAYSLRERTHAHRRMEDNVPEDVKQERLRAMIDVFKKNQLLKQMDEVGKYHLMLIDGVSKRSDTQFTGLTDTNKRVVIDNSLKVHESWKDYTSSAGSSLDLTSPSVGDFVKVKIEDASQNTLFGTPICKSSISDFEVSMKDCL